MSGATANRWRNNPFDRGSSSPSPAPVASHGRPKPAVISSAPNSSNGPIHGRTQSFSPLGGPSMASSQSTRNRSNSNRTSQQSSSTFAPTFIKAEQLQRDGEKIGGIEGENDFSGKRYVWLKDPHTAFVRGWVVEELPEGQLLVQCDDGNVRSHEVFLGQRHLLINPSNERFIRKAWTKSILRSSTRLMIWPNSLI